MTEVPSSGFYRGGVHVLPLRVYYEDTDFSGAVYHASFIRFLERGRSESLRASGIDHRMLAALADPLAFAVRRLEVDYMRPARIDDALEVHTSYEEGSAVRILAHQGIFRGAEQLVRAQVEIVCIGGDGRPRRMPAELRPVLARSAPARK
jgi:acyl-CoA thioester hydrolase